MGKQPRSSLEGDFWKRGNDGCVHAQTEGRRGRFLPFGLYARGDGYFNFGAMWDPPFDRRESEKS